MYHFALFCFATLHRALIAPLNALPLAPAEQLPAANEPVDNHYILGIRPEYGTDINKMISDIVDVLNRVSLDYPAPERHKKYRRPPSKVDRKGWRYKLNERWKKKMKFIRAMLRYRDVSNNEFQDDGGRGTSSERESMENSYFISVRESYSNSRESHSEKFYVGPYRDEDDNLNETILFKPHRVTMLKAMPNGTQVTQWE